jgi:hypothetical protein
MNPELQKAIADVLTVVKDGAQFAAATARQELPLLVTEYLRIGVVNQVVVLVFFLAGALALWIASRRLLALDVPKTVTGESYHGGTYTRDNPQYPLQQFWGRWAIPSLAVVVPALGVVLTVPTIMRILVAPRVYLLETLGRLVS